MLIDIPIELIELEDSSYHLMIQAVFNSNISGNLIIDTGASKTVFDFGFVHSFINDLEAIEDQHSSGINAMITEAHTGVIPVLSIQKLVLENYPCILLDLSHINQLYQQYSDKHIAGLIGSDFLVAHEAVIDYSQKKLTLVME